MRQGLAVLGVAVIAAGCQKKQLEVVDDRDRPVDDYGLADLLAATTTFSATSTSPIAYRALAIRIDELRPRFNDRVARQAELDLVFLAIGPLAAQLTAAPEAQLASLATTVWPTAFRVEPQPEEDPRRYLERVCSGPLAAECKYVVPEAWPRVLSAKVWRRLKNRAREALDGCALCRLDPTFERVLEDYDRHDTEQQAAVRLIGDRAGPGFWPRAAGHAVARSDAPLLELGADTVTFDGEPMRDDEWRRLLAERRGTHAVLGIHLRPRQEVRVLRAAMAEAARARWSEVALQVREPSFPWDLREYRLATRRGAKLMVRDVDSIQVLVQALDAAAGRLARRGKRSLPTL